MEKEFHVFFSDEGGLAEVHVGLLGQIIPVEGGSNFDPFVGFLPPQRTTKIQPKLTSSFAVISWPKRTNRRLTQIPNPTSRRKGCQTRPFAGF